jgi:hypothetical protein
LSAEGRKRPALRESLGARSIPGTDTVTRANSAGGACEVRVAAPGEAVELVVVAQHQAGERRIVLAKIIDATAAADDPPRRQIAPRTCGNRR